MNAARDPGRKALEEALKTARERRERARDAGPPTLWQHLSMVGALGWIIVLPTVLAALLGRWIDHRLGTGIAFSALFILAGIALSGWLAWQRIAEEEEDIAPPENGAPPRMAGKKTDTPKRGSAAPARPHRPDEGGER